ncbi:hypothetical protein KKG31_07010 [Patescibacteria group bacterium]|nr:hypothetical protein [Patescibacteria group bacterium]MBU1758834.1 hypothetical protein [Patescibacteria group bacterium]
MGEEISLLEKTKKVENGRSTGIFYEKWKLIELIESNKALKKAKLAIIEIMVPNDAIVNPNHEKFGIKNGKTISIITMQPFKEAMVDVGMLETA